MDATAITVADRKPTSQSGALLASRMARSTPSSDGCASLLALSVKQGHIPKAATSNAHSQPKPVEGIHLTRAEIRRADGSRFLHAAGNDPALHDCNPQRRTMRLTWVASDFERERIDLRDPTITRPHKARAIVPMLRTAKAALQEAKRGGLTSTSSSVVANA